MPRVAFDGVRAGSPVAAAVGAAAPATSPGVADVALDDPARELPPRLAGVDVPVGQDDVTELDGGARSVSGSVPRAVDA